jgi:hypothetical protein
MGIELVNTNIDIINVLFNFLDYWTVLSDDL